MKLKKRKIKYSAIFFICWFALLVIVVDGIVVRDDSGQLFHHTHALFSFKKEGQHGMAGGHLKATTVLYTAEIELRPTIGGAIGRKFDPETGTGFWEFRD